MPRDEQLCAECGRVTRFVVGRCPNCGAVADASRLPATRPMPGGGLVDDLDDVLFFAGCLVPGGLVAALVLAGVLPAVALLASALLALVAAGRALF
jgi:hypothetical protein